MTRREWSDHLWLRLKLYAVAILKLSAELTATQQGRMVVGQLMRSGTSPGAQYSEARRAKSIADFISKVEGSLQELDETLYWLDLVVMTGMVDQKRIESIRRETGELIAMFVTMVKSAKAR